MNSCRCRCSSQHIVGCPIVIEGQITALAQVSLCGALYFALVLVVVHVIRRDVNFLVDPISTYAVGKHSQVMATGLFAWSASTISLATGSLLAEQLFLGAVLLVAGAALFAASLAPMDLPFPPETWQLSGLTRTGRTHILSASGATLLFPIAAVLSLGAVFSGTNKLLASGSVVATILFLVSFGLFRSRYFGFTQRVFVIADIWWQLHYLLALTESVG